jgi:hypothetical protein
MHMKTEKLFTKRPMIFTAVRLPRGDHELLRAAAGKLGISQSEFFRLAIREKARRVSRTLIQPDQKVSRSTNELRGKGPATTPDPSGGEPTWTTTDVTPAITIASLLTQIRQIFF